MAMKPETVFRKRIQPDLEKLRRTVIIPIQQVAIRGVPDLLLCIRGVFVAIELKQSADHPPSRLQQWWISRILVAGGVAVVCYPENWKEIHRLLQMLAMGKPIADVLLAEERLRKRAEKRNAKELAEKQLEEIEDVQADVQ